MRDAEIVFTDNEVRCTVATKSLAKIDHLKATQRHLIVTEFATRLWIKSLDSIGPLYGEFEEELWAQLSREANLDKLMGDLARNDKVSADARKRYYAYIQSVF